MKKEEFSFSGLNKGYINRQGKAVLQVNPDMELTLQQVHDYIVSDAAKAETERLRQIKDHDKAQEFKKLNLRVALFGGLFSKRNAQSLYKASGLMVIDIDGLESEQEARRINQLLIKDRRINVALNFLSPGGKGCKNVLGIDVSMGLDYKAYFNWVYRYLLFEYGIEIDVSGSDICRACYLPHDPQCYINPNFLTNNQNGKDNF